MNNQQLLVPIDQMIRQTKQELTKLEWDGCNDDRVEYLQQELNRLYNDLKRGVLYEVLF